MDEQETWWRLSASEAACYKYPDDTDVAKAERAAFIEGFVTVARNTQEALKSVGALPTMACDVPPERDLPDWDDIRGRAPDATGGLSSETFVRGLRSDWRRK